MTESSSLKSAQTLETKSRILKSALHLFNERGTESVTTHDIAKAADISPGNLYYHYKNKAAIIRELFYQIEILSINQWWKKGPANREVQFSEFAQFYFGAITKYRFFFREFSSLLIQDPILAREWRSMYGRLFSVMQEALQGWVARGLMKPFKSQEEADIFIESVWILTAFTQVHLEVRFGKKSKGYIEESQKLLARFLYPFHTPKGQRVIDLYLY